MKLAKATEKDIDAAGMILKILSMIDRGDYPMPEDPENAPDQFDPDEFNHLRHFYDLVMSSLENAPGWHNRVIGGMCYVILYDKNEIVDLNSSVLELHPRLTKALADQRKYDYLLENVTVMSDSGSCAFVGREEIEPFIESQLAAQEKECREV